MSRYEFSLRQEVLLEKGASVLGNLFRYKRENHITDNSHPVTIMYSLVWSAKQDILMAQSESALDQIEGQFNLANSFISEVEVGLDA